MANEVTFVWNGDQTMKQIEREMERRLDMAAEHLVTKIKDNISIPTRSVGPSEPGDPPHADTGRLRQSVGQNKTGKLERTIHAGRGSKGGAVSLKYAVWLEFGTKGAKKVTAKNAKALTIPLTAAQAERIVGRSLKGKGSRNAKKAAGIYPAPRRLRKKGYPYIALRKWAMLGHVKPRPFFFRTIGEEKRKVFSILGASGVAGRRIGQISEAEAAPKFDAQGKLKSKPLPGWAP